MKKNGSKEIIASVDRSIDIIEFICSFGGKAKINEIAKGLNMNKSTVHRSLNTLKMRGYIYQDIVDLSYGIGPKFSVVGQCFRENTYFVNKLKPEMSRLSKKYNICANLSIVDNMSVDSAKQLSIYRVEPEGNILGFRAFADVSSECHSSSTGKCFLAFSPNTYINRYVGKNLKKYTDKTITNWEDLFKELEKVRLNQYATDEGELETGLSCIAVPVFNQQKELVASLSLTGPTVRLQIFSKSEIVEDLREAARKIL